MSDWIRPFPPVSGAIDVDFAQRLASGTDKTGETRQVTLAGVAHLSPGEWTLYLLRLCYLDDPTNAAPPATITKISLQAGTDKGRGDLLGLELTTVGTGNNMQTGNALFRGVCFHVTAGQLDCSITYLPQTRTNDDRILAWVAPGRPQVTRLEGKGTTAAQTALAGRANAIRVPAFSRRVRVNLSTGAAVNPQIAFWQGPTFVTSYFLPVPGPNASTASEWLIPQEATHMAFFDLAGPPGGQLVYYQYEIES